MFRLALLFSLVLLAALPARAQTVCTTHDALMRHLSTTYSEEPVAVGLAATGQLIEVLASADGSWTLITTSPEGLSCIRAWGEGWTNTPPEASPTEELLS